MRFGIIGLAWRTGRSEHNTIFKRDELLDDVGMTRAEADMRSSASTKAFLCVVLQVKGQPVGILYMDSTNAEAFKDVTHDKREKLIADAEKIGLSEAIYDVGKSVRGRTPHVKMNA